MSCLTKLFGFRPPYASVLEAQNSGNPHYHVVLFGISRIMDHYKLTKVLEKIGFGPIHFEYKIVKENGKWVWAKSKPKGMSKDVQDYLVKYLTETLSTFSDESTD